MKIIYFILFLFLLYCVLSIENFKNHYEKNEVPPDKPDDVQFYSCRQDKFNDNPDYPFQKYPNSNYRIKKNKIKAPKKGTFSAFLESQGIRKHDEFYHAPICEEDNESYNFNTNIDSQFRLIPGAFPEEDIQEILEEEIRKDSHDLRDPNYTYGNPQFIGNKLLYNNEIQDIFLRVKLEMDKHHEDDSHLVNDHQYKEAQDE